MAAKLLYAISVVAYFLTAYLIVVWVGMSLAITDNGPIRWSDGWGRVVGYLREDVGWHDDTRSLQTVGIGLRDDPSSLGGEARSQAVDIRYSDVGISAGSDTGE